nr:MAG TPA: hypothetical protein [Caudoviricetes sp.]
MPTNPIATPKVYIVRCKREEGIAKSQPDEQKSDIRHTWRISWRETVKSERQP